MRTGVRAQHGIVGATSDGELAAVLRHVKLRVVVGCAFPERVREVYAGGVVGIRAGLAPDWVRWLTCHGLGHHMLHRGNHLYAQSPLYLWERQELEAELFAGTLLFGAAPPLGLCDLAEHARVPLSCVHSWQAALLSAQQEPAAAQGPPCQTGES